uniref:Potassium channel blocker pMeKTx7-2 n=1 Tax=Mesobuthus eupeus TaxID=34648 RepID=A0A088DB30_MESEU|nr:potassium channel blocker pMeKTx7-2 [Mesobuthus eupeus]
MKFIIVLILIGVLIATTVPMSEAQRQCQTVRDCYKHCQSPKRCTLGTCYCEPSPGK